MLEKYFFCLKASHLQFIISIIHTKQKKSEIKENDESLKFLRNQHKQQQLCKKKTYRKTDR